MSGDPGAKHAVTTDTWPFANAILVANDPNKSTTTSESSWVSIGSSVLLVGPVGNYPAASSLVGTWAFDPSLYQIYYSDGTVWQVIGSRLPYTNEAVPFNSYGLTPIAIVSDNDNWFYFGYTGDGNFHRAVAEGVPLANGIDHGLTQAKNFVAESVNTGSVPAGNSGRIANDGNSLWFDNGVVWQFAPLLITAAFTDDGTNLTCGAPAGAGGGVIMAADSGANVTISGSACTVNSADIKIANAGKTISRKQGATAGDAVLVAGTKTVNTVISLAATDSVRLENVACGGTPGAVYISARTNGAPNTASITITSTNAADTSTIRWVVEHKI